MLNIHERQLLALLSAALFDREPQTDLFTEDTRQDWEAITKLSKEQSVLGLVVERMLTMPKELQAERPLRIELALGLELVLRHYKAYNKKLQAIYQEYEDEGLFTVMLKGLTMSKLYPRPELRSLGDVDLFLPKTGDYDRANAWVKSKGYRLHGSSIYEQAYVRDRLMVENHRLLSYFGIPRYDKALSEIIEQIDRADDWAYITIEDRRYRTLPLELNAVYTFHHILHHFSYLGIGLRQICDWILLLKEQGERLNIDVFNDYAQRLDLLRPMQLFALMAVRHLSVPADIFPFALPADRRSEELADLIIRDTFEGGNFGFEHFAGRKFSNIWFRRWFMFRRTTWRSIKVSEVSPEHIRLIPLIAIWTRLKLLFRRY